jgi:hypothetical protein
MRTCLSYHRTAAIAAGASLFVGLILNPGATPETLVAWVVGLVVVAIAFSRVYNPDVFRETSDTPPSSRGTGAVVLAAGRDVWRALPLAGIAIAFYVLGAASTGEPVNPGASAGGIVSGALLGIPAGCYLSRRRSSA